MATNINGDAQNDPKGVIPQKKTPNEQPLPSAENQTNADSAKGVFSGENGVGNGANAASVPKGKN